MAVAPQVILTGIKPTGELHIGNYFGALQGILQYAKKYPESTVYLFIADLHAVTTDEVTAEQLREYTRHILTAYYVFCGDVKNIVLYRQSDFPEITALAWLFTSLLTVPYLKRGHAFKDSAQQGLDEKVRAGVLLYPTLMAADILIMDADVVPVGHDQLQHLEVTRDIVRKFNDAYSSNETLFKEPQAGNLSSQSMEVMGTDGRKMSKSYSNTISLFAEEDVIEKQIATIVTDSTPLGKPLDSHGTVCQLLKLLLSDEKYTDVQRVCEGGKTDYKSLKETLLQAHLDYFGPFRHSYETYRHSDSDVMQRIEKDKQIVRKQVEEKLEQIKKAVGLTL